MATIYDSTKWEELVAQLPSGKRVADVLYLHFSALPAGVREIVLGAATQACIPHDSIVVCKFHTSGPKFSILDYPGFFSEAFPILRTSWSFDCATGDWVERQYEGRTNRPVLHRKERLLFDDHPEQDRFAKLTAEAEAAGLFSDTAIIGMELEWKEELAARGLTVVGHSLVHQAIAPNVAVWRAARHRTALSRTGLSSPVQALWSHGLLRNGSNFFDYGCGRGDDVAFLSDQGVEATGWDPWFQPSATQQSADVVNLGFVLNVIEDLAERRQALAGAWRLTARVLSVAALIGGRTVQDRWRLFQDGVLTSRGTFQKYFSHAELGLYIADVLTREPVAVQPGVYFVFRSDEDEQDFLAQRQRTSAPTRNSLVSVRHNPMRAARSPTTRTAPSRRGLSETQDELARDFWNLCLSLGRLPEAEEWSRLDEVVRSLGRPETVMRRLLRVHGNDLFEAARLERMADLRVYLALQMFSRRQSFSRLSTKLQRDIRAFWSSLSRAQDDAKALLFATGTPENVAAACVAAQSDGNGWLERDVSGSVASLHCLSEQLQLLPALLRVYVGCAERLYGDLASADVVKVHARSAKVSALTYDDFHGHAVPMLVERVKIDLRRQEVQLFGYGTEQFPAQPFWQKSRLLRQGTDVHAQQIRFEESLAKFTRLDFGGYGPDLSTVEGLLSERGLSLSDWPSAPEHAPLTGPAEPDSAAANA